MLCLAAVALAISLAGGAVLAEPSPAAKRAYTDRVLTMDDSAASHVELAKWCQANGLSDRAQLHWSEALVRDADNAEARAALGYVRFGTEWRLASEVQVPAAAAGGVAAAAPAAFSPAQDPTFAERRLAFSREIQDLSIRYLGTSDPASRDAGRLELLMIRDPAAAEPVARILGIGPEDSRKLACEVLGQIPGDEAAKLLVKFVLSDASDAVVQAAAAALAGREGDRGLQPLINALNGSERALNRAAYALGEIGDLAAAPALIAHLRTPETKVLKAPAGGDASSGSGGAYIFTGTVITYIANARPVVAQAAIGWDLQIGAIPVGTMLSVGHPRVTIYRTIIEYVPRPAVRDALQKMTGENHEYNSADWRAALSRQAKEQSAAP